MGDTRTGLVVVASHLVALLAALGLLAIHLALGAWVRSRMRATSDAGASWRLPVDAALGAGALATLLFALGLVGALDARIVLLVVGVVAVVVRRELVALAADLGRLVSGGAATAAVSGLSLLRAALVAILLLLVVGALAPPTEWDSLMYHLRIPLWLLDEGRWGVPPDSFHVALVGVSHFATLPLLALGLEQGPALMQVAAFALTLAGTYDLARRSGAGVAGRWIAIAALLGTPVFALVAITARVDVSLVLMLLAAHLTLLEGARRTHDPEADRSGEGARLLLVAACLVGAAVAIKPQAGAYAIALVPLGWRAAGSWRRALAAAGVAIAASAPWMLKNLWLVGAPLYPKGAPGWFEPWLAGIFGGKVRPPEVDAAILDALPESRESFDLLSAFFDPGALTIEGEGAFYALSPGLLLVPLLILQWRRRPPAFGSLLVALLYVTVVVVPFGRINLRYLMPAVPALAAVLGPTVEWLVSRASPAMRRITLVAVGLFAILPLTGALRQRFLDPHVVLLRHALGLASAEEVWFRHPDGTARGYAPVIANIQRMVPRDGKVLMLWEARALPFAREAIADVMLSNWSFLAQSTAPERCLAGTGITHLLVGGGSVEYYVNRGADPVAFRLGEFRRFRDRCLTGHRTIGPGFEYFEVRPTPVR